MQNDIVITGVGIIDALGKKADDCFSAYINPNQNPIAPILLPNDNIPEISEVVKEPLRSMYGAQVREDFMLASFTAPKAKHLSKSARLALYVVEEALRDAGFETEVPNNAGVVFSSLSGGMEYREQETTAMYRGTRASPKHLLCVPQDFVCSLISNTFKLNGINTSVYAACATGIISIDYACKILREEQYDYMVVGATDTMVNITDLLFFKTLGALSTEPSPNASRPFDQTRNGFVMGEGAACLILETKEKALKRGAKIYGTIGGIGVASDTYSFVAPDPNGFAAKKSMIDAMKKTNISRVDYINAHATSTPLGDEVEYRSIEDVFGTMCVSSIKGKIGHTMGAAGVIETIYTLMMMKHNLACQNANLHAPIEGKLVLPSNPTDININAALNNSFGFGGKCASICLLKE